MRRIENQNKEQTEEEERKNTSKERKRSSRKLDTKQKLLTQYILTKPRAPGPATVTPPSRAAGTPRAAGRGARGRIKEGKGGAHLLGKWFLQGSGNREAGRSQQSARGGKAGEKEGLQEGGISPGRKLSFLPQAGGGEDEGGEGRKGVG